MTSQAKGHVPTWLIFASIFCVLYLLSQCSETGATTSDATASPVNEDLWVERGKESVRAKLKDPASAAFRHTIYHQGKRGIPLTCGEVNSRNSFGDYGGYQAFVSAGSPELTYLAQQMDKDEFAKTWNELCED